MTQELEAAANVQPKSNEDDINRYVTFTISSETYGVALNYVKEIIAMTDITSVPRLPDFFSGVINVRGKIISVIDLSKKLSLEDKSITKSILIIEVESMTLGVIVGHINEVITFEQDQLQTSENSKSQLSNEYISSVAKQSDRTLVMILDIPKIFTAKELKIPQREQQ